MGNLLFSPTGRITPAEFQKAGYVLIAVSALISLAPLVSMSLATILGIASLAVLYCWVAIFIKRYHEGGKSGWNVFIPIIAYFVLSLIATLVLLPILLGIMAPDVLDLQTQMEQNAQAAAESGDFGAIFGAAMEGAEDIARASAIPSTILGVLVSLAILFGFNKIIPVDAGDNQYGPAGATHIA